MKPMAGVTSDERRAFYRCFICERSFQFGGYLYEGNLVCEWGLHVCHRCRQDNMNGIDCARHPHVEHVLKFRSVPFRVNRHGFIEIPTGKSPRRPGI